MQKKQVATIDVGSSKITVAIGERGINKTFIIKGRTSFDYDGFECADLLTKEKGGAQFFDAEQIVSIIYKCAEFIKKTVKGALPTVYVGVPGAFTSVVVKDSQISFPKKKKITEEDVDALFDAAFVSTLSDNTLINRSAIVYELDDYRRLAYPVGAVSEILKGKLSFVFCTNYFYKAIVPILEGEGLNKVECISIPHAEAMYLVDAETRDRIAEILDVGYITTTFTIIQGDGIIYQQSFNYGGGYITATLMEEFDISFEDAENLKRKVNLSCVNIGSFDVIETNVGEYYSVDEVNRIVRKSLGSLCEQVSLAIEQSGYSVPEYVPLKVTGGGISYIRGAKEHLSNRLNTVVEIVAPKVPMMEKTTESSLLSLLDMALEQN